MEKPMSLDEAIEHALEKAQGSNLCSPQHKQLADWLSSYRELSKQSVPKEEIKDIINTYYFDIDILTRYVSEIAKFCEVEVQIIDLSQPIGRIVGQCMLLVKGDFVLVDLFSRAIEKINEINLNIGKVI
jgi:hypothetical protein